VDLRDIRYFSVLAEELHFGRASERIGISTPGLSAAIKRLEGEAGVLLFERLPRGARLTRAGHLLCDGAQRMLAAHATLLASIRRQAQAGGAMRIACPGWLPHGWLAPVLAQLARRDPKALFVQAAVGSLAPEAALAAGEADAAVIVGSSGVPRLQGRTLESLPIGEDPAVPIVRIGHPRLRAPVASTVAVLREEWVAAAEDPVEEAFDRHAGALIGEPRRIGARVDDVAAMIDAVVASDRVGWCPVSMLPYVRDRIEPLAGRMGRSGLVVPRTLLLARCAGDELPGWSELVPMLALRHRMLVSPFLRDGGRFASGGSGMVAGSEPVDLDAFMASRGSNAPEAVAFSQGL